MVYPRSDLLLRVAAQLGIRQLLYASAFVNLCVSPGHSRLGDVMGHDGF